MSTAPKISTEEKPSLPDSAPMSETVILQAIGHVLDHPNALSDDTYLDPERRLVFTTDILVEDRHFSMDYFSPEDLGWKAAAVNLSDIAASGTQPLYFLIALGIPSNATVDDVSALYTGFTAACQQVADASQTPKAQVIGGDTVSSPQWIINVTAVGVLPEGHNVVRRRHALPGDLVYSTGESGLSAAGMLALQHNLDGLEAAKQRHLRPTPRIAEGLFISKTLQTPCMMDSSDGLADALLKIAHQSQVRVEVFQSSIGIHPDVKTLAGQFGFDMDSVALYGGEDFELVGTIPADWNVLKELPATFQIIGRVVEKQEDADTPEAVVLDQATESVLQALDPQNTYQHFSPVLSETDSPAEGNTQEDTQHDAQQEADESHP